MSLLNIFKPREPLVMLVDDDPMLLEMYEAYLGALNCKSIKVFDGKDALAMVERHKPQLILLDIMMQGITGLQILESLKLKSSTKNIPVLMITGERKIGDLETAFKLGAADYMIKPVELAPFEQKIKTLLSSAGYSFPGVK
ncbi:MAG: response regulator [Elusimicrobia bacterium]|nr:response regulator [Elusimicrobiota bacterium]